ncbi:hypothetical protein KSZ_73300 [Dictyobacter formicarum]|uniref:Uncharacterized protein n=1 Tax=Dictyobacter formicarum TaxID=2778368 RepID=A0ABQ3VSR8_9CHLR|nr:hypothetical protein KSZ_73300 [Dictyobacter formicarum]
MEILPGQVGLHPPAPFLHENKVLRERDRQIEEAAAPQMAAPGRSFLQLQLALEIMLAEVL